TSEFLEELRHDFLFDADTRVSELEEDLTVFLFKRDSDGALRGIFHRVIDNVHDYLAEFIRVSFYLVCSSRDRNGLCQALCIDIRLLLSHDIIHEFSKIHLFQVIFHRAKLDARDVQVVLNNIDHRLDRRIDSRDHLLNAVRHRAVIALENERCMASHSRKRTTKLVRRERDELSLLAVKLLQAGVGDLESFFGFDFSLNTLNKQIAN